MGGAGKVAHGAKISINDVRRQLTNNGYQMLPPRDLGKAKYIRQIYVHV